MSRRYPHERVHPACGLAIAYSPTLGFRPHSRQARASAPDSPCAAPSLVEHMLTHDTLGAALDAYQAGRDDTKDQHDFDPIEPAGIKCSVCGFGRHHPWHAS